MARYCAGVLTEVFDSRRSERPKLVAQTAVVVFTLPMSELANLRGVSGSRRYSHDHMVFQLDQRRRDMPGRLLALEDS
jgi:hypothetical protein